MDERDYSERALQELLGANTIFPEQYWNAFADSTNRSGERALMWAVFADGIESFRRNAGASSTQRRIEFMEAESWMLRSDTDWPFSFVNLCEAFGFKPAGVRRALLRWKAENKEFRRQRFRPVTLRAA